MRGPVLLTGGSGFLGSHIADGLAARGVEVRALVRPSSSVAHLSSLPGVTLVQGSLGNPDSLADALRGVRAVIHAAGLIKALRPGDFHRANAEGTGNLLRAARRAAGDLHRFVHVSSLAAVGPSPDGRPRPADAPPAPVTEYGRSKLAAEASVRAAANDLQVVVVRPPVVYGPRDRETLAFYQAVKWGVLPVTGSLDAILSMIYVTDCAEACIRAVDASVPSGSVYDVEDGAPSTFRTILGHIETAMGARVRLRVPIPGPALRMAALGSQAFGRLTGKAMMFTPDKVNELRAPNWVCDGAAARRDLGWDPVVPLEEGARRSTAWYRAAGWL